MSVHKSLPHDSARLHVTGQARYVDDIPSPAGTLHLAFGLSDFAHGRITALDLSDVRTAPGVVAVQTADDVGEADCSASAHDEPLLAQGVLQYAGQPLFLVVAESHLAARKAARLARVSHEARPAILNVEQALAANSRFEDGPRLWSRGQPESAIAAAPHRLEGRAQEHFYLEGQATLALPQEGGDMVIACSSQHPTEIQHKVAEALGLPMHAVRVEVRRMGGGFGGPQGMLGIERVMDHIAHHLRLDPLIVRRANYYRAAAAVAKSGPGTARRFGGAHSPQPPVDTSPQTTPYGQQVEDFILHDLTDRLADQADYSARRAAIADWNRSSPVLKKGIALTPVKFGISFTLTHLNQAGALVHVYRDGSVQLNHGGTELGQGLFQKVAQVAANVFGLGLEAVKITATDTGKVPNTSATATSSGSDLNGMAVKAACEVIRDRIARVIAARHQGQATAIRFEGGQVRAPGHDYSFAEAARLTWAARESLSATGFYRTPKLEWDRLRRQGRPFHYFAYGTAVSEVVIDTLSGEYRILRADILHDAGASLNPALDIGQIEGGYVQGAGWLTAEEIIWDAQGRLRTHAPSTYRIPATGDRPRVFNVALWDGATREETIHRSKAVGEPPLMLGISVLMALSDAVAGCGDGTVYPALDAPATPERVLMTVMRQRGEDA